MSSLAFTVPDSQSANILRIVAAYSGNGGHLDIAVRGIEDTEFIDSDGTKLSGIHTAARHIAHQGSKAEQLLGASPEDQAKISEWLAFHHTNLTPLMDDKVAVFNGALENSTFLVGNTITLADLVLYVVVQPGACSFPIAQHGHFSSLLRWYDYINNVADTSKILPAASFSKPRYVAPPASVPKEKKQSAVPADNAKEKTKSIDSSKPHTPAESLEVTKGKKSDRKMKKAEAFASSGASAASLDDGSLPVDILDLRVGKIVKVDRHPNADSLYLEEIDVGEGQPRQVVSGLVKFVPVEKMQDRTVIVVCNLKPAKMRDIMSYGMVLCSSSEAHDQVDPIIPPEGVSVGERITFEGYNNEPEAQLNPKKKQLEKILPFLKTSQGTCISLNVGYYSGGRSMMMNAIFHANTENMHVETL